MDDIAWGWPALSGEEPWSQGCDVFRAQPLLGERHGDGGLEWLPLDPQCVNC